MNEEGRETGGFEAADAYGYYIKSFVLVGCMYLPTYVRKRHCKPYRALVPMIILLSGFLIMD
jgi:hypothetical protein